MTASVVAIKTTITLFQIAGTAWKSMISLWKFSRVGVKTSLGGIAMISAGVLKDEITIQM
jgi:hypothetical protein